MNAVVYTCPNCTRKYAFNEDSCPYCEALAGAPPQGAVAAVTNVLPQGFDKASWDHVAQALLNQVEDHASGD